MLHIDDVLVGNQRKRLLTVDRSPALGVIA
jgi:hypothetical protein